LAQQHSFINQLSGIPANCSSWIYKSFCSCLFK